MNNKRISARQKSLEKKQCAWLYKEWKKGNKINVSHCVSYITDGKKIFDAKIDFFPARRLQ